MQSRGGESLASDPKNNDSDWDTGDSVRGQRILFYSRKGLKSSIGISYLDWAHFVAWITNANLTFLLLWKTAEHWHSGCLNWFLAAFQRCLLIDIYLYRCIPHIYLAHLFRSRPQLNPIHSVRIQRLLVVLLCSGDRDDSPAQAANARTEGLAWAQSLWGSVRLPVAELVADGGADADLQRVQSGDVIGYSPTDDVPQRVLRPHLQTS